MVAKAGLAKVLFSLSGKERARIFLKHRQAKMLGIEAAPLNDADRQALSYGGDVKEAQEFYESCQQFGQAEWLRAFLLDAFNRLMFFNSKLDAVRAALVQATTLRYIAHIIRQHMTDKFALEESLGILGMMQAVSVQEQGEEKQDKIYIKEPYAGFIKETVAEMFAHACEVMSLLSVADKLNDELGFDAFFCQGQGVKLQEMRSVVRKMVESHNDIIYLITKDREMENINVYLIPEPILNSDLVKEWEGEMLKI